MVERCYENVCTGLSGALINVLRNDLCVKPVTLFIHIRYYTWHMIHEQSTMTFTIPMNSFSLYVADKGECMPAEAVAYGLEL